MKKIIRVILIIILIIVLLGIIKGFKNKSIKSDEDAKITSSYIWTDDIEIPVGYAPGEWVCFRKNIDINKDVNEASFKIAADSKYWLYINGKLVIPDGGLKRGEEPDSIYYDEIDVKDFLEEGKNNISILVWYYGKSVYSHVDSGQGALLVDGRIDGKKIVTDSSWKVERYLPFENANEINGQRLSESNLVYDASKEMPNWYKKDFDDSSWKNAKVVGKARDKKWGKLIKREIPFFTYEDIKEYKNFEDYKDQVLTQDIILEMKPDYNMQLYPYFKVEAKAGQKIAISNRRDFNNIDEYGKVDYIAKDGIQEFESPAWINGENIYYYIPKGTKIISLGYRKTRYKVQSYGEFSSSDQELNTLWTMAKRTLEVNMRDNYMDCPDRERALWMGDATIEMEEAIYALDPNANALYEKAIKSFLGWKENGVFNTVPSSAITNQQLPIQNLMTIVSIYNYYEYTGDTSLMKEAYPELLDYLRTNWEVSEEGIVNRTDNYKYNLNEWYDAAKNPDEELEEIVWLYYAYSTLGKMANVLDTIEVEQIQLISNSIKDAINENYWDGLGYKSKEYKGYSVRANSVAIISGIAGEEKYKTMTSIIVGNYDNSTFMERYPLEALCIMDKQNEAIARMKIQYKEMIEDEPNNSTLWEYWDRDEGTRNHAWSGSPLMILSKYIAGVIPNKPGFEEVLIKPSFDDLEEVHAKVNTVKGTITVNGNRKDSSLYLSIDVPTDAIVAVEKLSLDPKIFINGEKIEDASSLSNRNDVKFEKQDEKYFYFRVTSGEYIFVSKK